jgi:hypothetical protein
LGDPTSILWQIRVHPYAFRYVVTTASCAYARVA